MERVSNKMARVPFCPFLLPREFAETLSILPFPAMYIPLVVVEVAAIRACSIFLGIASSHSHVHAFASVAIALFALSAWGPVSSSKFPGILSFEIALPLLLTNLPGISKAFDVSTILVWLSRLPWWLGKNIKLWGERRRRKREKEKAKQKSAAGRDAQNKAKKEKTEAKRMEDEEATRRKEERATIGAVQKAEAEAAKNEKEMKQLLGKEQKRRENEGKRREQEAKQEAKQQAKHEAAQQAKHEAAQRTKHEAAQQAKHEAAQQAKHEAAQQARQQAKRSVPEQEQPAPDEYYCPITTELMQNPVFASDGHTYEREAIEAWSVKGGATVLSPMTNEPLLDRVLTPNRSMRVLILDWQSARYQQESGASNMPIREWLVSVSPHLACYAAALKECGYDDTDLLLEATGGDIEEAVEELHMKKGHRRVLMNALATLQSRGVGE
jgi:hypothetical protein